MLKLFSFLFVTSLIYVSVGMMTGGWSKVEDVNSDVIQNYAKMATAKLSSSMNSLFHLKLINITKAEKQVVSGMNYEFELIIGPTECKKNGNHSKVELEDCPLQKCGRPLNCTVKLWVQAWRPDGFKVTKQDCKPGDSIC